MENCIDYRIGAAANTRGIFGICHLFIGETVLGTTGAVAPKAPHPAFPSDRSIPLTAAADCGDNTAYRGKH